MKPKKKPAKKSKKHQPLTMEVGRRCLDRIRKGALLLEDAAREEGISVATVREWERRGINREEPYSSFLTETLIAVAVREAREGNKKFLDILKSCGLEMELGR